MNPNLIFLATLQIGSTENQFVQAVVQSGPFAKLILLVIAFFSIVSWAMIFHKLWQYRKIRAQNDEFLDDFNKMGGDFGSLSQRSDQLRTGTIPLIFSESYRELRAVGRIREQELLFDRPQLALVQRRMERTVGQQIVALEKGLIFLATTANVCPFLGLLGTVWGVLGTFMTMTTLETSLTLRLIGPGISEALTTTIFGLAAAIPAVVAYNYLVNRVAVYRMEMEDFALRLLAILEKNILARSTSAEPTSHSTRRREEPALQLADKVIVE